MEPYDIEEAFAAIEEELIASMMRNMKRHKVEESAEDKRWEMWQAKQLQALEKYKKQNQKKFQKQFSNINGSVDEIIHKARKQGGLDQEIKIMNAIKKGWKPPSSLKKSMQTNGEFFKLNDRKLNALIGATQKDFSKAEYAMLRMADDQYRKIVFNAQVYANTGAGTYEKAVDMATKDFLGSGINCIEYKNGARHKISDYAFMAIQTASKRAYLTGEGERRQEWGISTVIVNKRGNPCPKCLPFVGKVLVDDVWSGGKSSGTKYPLMSTAIAAGLYHPRCKDNHTTYFPGISTADNTWTKQELEAIEKTNKQESKQQYAQRQAAKFKRLAKFSLDEDNQRMYESRFKDWSERSEKDLLEHAIKFENKENADTYHRERTESLWEKLENKEKEALWRYTGSDYRHMNSALRNETVSKSDKNIQDAINNMTNAINKSQIQDDLCVRRGVSANGIAGLLGIDKEDLISKVNDSLIDTIVTEKGFMSTGVTKEAGFPGINLEVYLPKGTKAIYAEPFSRYGGTNTDGTWDGLQKASYIGGEAELIIQRNSQLKIKKIEKDSKGYITNMVLILVNQI